MPEMKPAELIADAITRERERAGLSLSQLATKAGLAKSTLSQLEAGKGNPSIETLWAIAGALEIPFSFLFEGSAPQSRLIRAGEGEALAADSAQFSAVLLAKCPPGVRRDLYRIDLKKGMPRTAKAHPRGSVEHAFVCQGSVRLGPDGATQDIHVGDYYRYCGDMAHSYEALSPEASIMLVMESIG